MIEMATGDMTACSTPHSLQRVWPELLEVEIQDFRVRERNYEIRSHQCALMRFSYIHTLNGHE